MAPGFEYRLLGPVGVEHDGIAVPIIGAKQQTLLATLLVDANRVVSSERLIARIWEDAPPAKALGALHTQVARLRRLLTEQTGTDTDPIATHANGYLITVFEQDLDLYRFNAQIQAADAAAATGRLPDAVTAYDQALAEWHGEPLGGTCSESLRREVGSALTERHLSVTEARLDAVLRLGRHQQALADLAELTAAHPLRERFWEQYMLALYRSGRQGDALAAYRDVSTQLAEELGVEPGTGLRDLHQRILAADPDLIRDQATQPVIPTARPARVVPGQLPASIRHFTGRAAELKVLNELLSEATAKGPVVISAIGGTAGIGKTALAVHWAHLHADRFPDGQLYVNLRGFDPSNTPMPAGDVVRHLLDALGIPAQRIPTSPDEQAGLYRSVLADRRMLVLLDNARDAIQVRPLLPASPGTLVLVTSRNQLGTLIALDGAVPLTLDLLTHDEALNLLTRRLGHERVHADERASSELIDLCVRLPLALNIAAARAALRPAHPLSACVDELRDARQRLDALAVEGEVADIRAVFSWSYRALDSETAGMFRLLGLHPGPDVSVPAAASLTALDLDRTRRALNKLSAAHLLTEHAPGRYMFHDLLQAYAAEQAHTNDSPTDRDAALRRVCDFYTHTAYSADRLMDAPRPLIQLDPPSPGSDPLSMADMTAATAWFDAEHANLLAAQESAAEHFWHGAVYQLAWVLTTFLRHRGRLRDQIAAWQAGLRAAEQLPDPTPQTVAHRLLGRAYTELGDPEEGMRHLQQALALAEQHFDLTQQAHSHRLLAWTWELRGDDRQALYHSTHSLDLYRTLDQPLWEADALNGIGWHAAHLGEYDTARTHCEAALNLHRHHHNRDGEAATLDSLGYIAHLSGQYHAAIEYYQQAHNLLRSLGNNYASAFVFEHLGHPHAALGEYEQARTAWQRAHKLYQEQGRVQDADRVERQLNERLSARP